MSLADRALSMIGLKPEEAEAFKTGIFAMIRDAATVRDKVVTGERDVRALAGHFHERLMKLERLAELNHEALERIEARQRGLIVGEPNPLKPNGADHAPSQDRSEP